MMIRLWLAILWPSRKWDKCGLGEFTGLLLSAVTDFGATMPRLCPIFQSDIKDKDAAACIDTARY
jgi:hypothetical protein